LIIQDLHHGNSSNDFNILIYTNTNNISGEDKAAFISDVSTGRVIRRFQGHTQRINSIDLDDNGSVLLTGSYDKTVSCWDIRSNSRDPIQTLTDFKDSVSFVRHSNKATFGYIIASSVDGKIRIYDMRYGKMHSDNHTNPITCVSLSNDNKTYITCCLGDNIRLADISSGQLLRTFKGHQHRSYKIEACMTPDDKHIIAGDESGSIFSWDILTTDITQKTNTPVHTKAISCISHHPKQPLVLSSSYDSTVKCFQYQ